MLLAALTLHTFLFLALFHILIIIPFWKILPRVNISPWMSLCAAIPGGGLVLLWIVAFKQ